MRARSDTCSVVYSLLRRPEVSRLVRMASLIDVKKRIRALLISSKSGCSLKQLYHDYKTVIGEELPYSELGYRSLMGLIRDIPDVVRVKLNFPDQVATLYGVADEKTQHLARMVARQRQSRSAGNVCSKPPNRKPPPKRIPNTFGVQLKQLFLSYPNGVSLERFNDAFARRFGYYLKYTPWGYSTLEQLLEDVEDVELVRDPVRGSAVVKPRRNPKGQLDKKEPQEQESLNALETSPVKEKSFFKDAKTESTVKDTSGSAKPAKPPIPDSLIKNIKELLTANPAGVWLSQFSSHYKDYFGEDLPVFTQGYTTPLHLLSSLTHCCTIERPLVGTGDWLIVALGAMVKVAPNHGYISSAYISDELTATISRILSANPDGVPLRGFLTAYKEYTGKDLEMKELGFNTLMQLLERVEGVKVMKPPDAGFLMVYGPTKKKKLATGMAAASSDGCLSSENEEPPKPPGSMASAYTKQPIPGNKMMGVYVTHVHTPSCLCVQLIGENTTRALEYLLEDLTQFYNSSKGDGYMLKRPQIGQPCCTLFNNDGYWYRAEVVGLPSSDISEVLYVDYGNTGRVPTTSLRRPKPHYLTLPAQAVKCRLAHLKPAGSTWSRQASRLLFQMTKDRPIVAIISSVTDGLVSASLCDTTTEDDIHVNDTLVSQGLAIYVKDTEEEERKYNGYQPEPTPVGATEHVPDVRIPSHEGGLSTTSAPSGNPVPPSILPTPPPTPVPPGLPTPVPHDPTQLMHNYLLSQQLLQQAFLTGLKTIHPTSVSPTPFSTGPTVYNPTPLPHTTSLTETTPSIPTTQVTPDHSCQQPIGAGVFQPIDTPVTSSSPTLTSPTAPTPAPTTRTEEEAGLTEKKEDEGKQHQSPLPLIKKCQLTDKYSLHVLRHNCRAYVLSQQVSEWFWDTDLLQSMLRQAQKPVWGLLLQEHRAVELFREMKKIQQLRLHLYGRREVTVYALEDVPSIASTFHGPESLCTALKKESQKWLEEGLDYFHHTGNRELEMVTAALKELQVKKHRILALLAEEEDKGEGDIQERASQLVDITKSISRLKARKATLLSQTTSCRGDVSAGEGTTNSHQTSSKRSVSLTSPSKCNGYDVGSASQVSENDDTFYSCPSTLSSVTPDAVSPLAPSSTDFTVPSYTESTGVHTESTGVHLSPFRLSSSSSVSSLSDASICQPPPTSTCGATEFHTPAHSPNITREIAKGSGRPQTVTAGQYYNGSSIMKRDDRDIVGWQDTGGRTSVELALWSDEQDTSLSGQSATEIRSNPSGRSPTGVRTRPSRQSTTEHWSEQGSRSSSAVESGTRMTASQYQTTTATTSSLRCSPTRTGLSSGQGGFRTEFKHQNSSEELNSRTSIAGHPSNRSHTNAVRKPPRVRQSQKYRTSSYGTRPNLSGQGGSSRTTGSGQGGSRTSGSGQGGSRTTGSGQQINKRPSKDAEFNFSSPSSSGFSSPTELILNPTTTASYSVTSTSSTQSTHHPSTCHTIPSPQSTSVVTSQIATSAVLKPGEVERQGWDDLSSSEDDDWELKSGCVECVSDRVMEDGVKEGEEQTLGEKMIGFESEVIGKEGHSQELESTANEVERREECTGETEETWTLNGVGGCEVGQWEMEEWSDDVEVRETTKRSQEVVEVGTPFGGKEGEREREEEVKREGEEEEEREGEEVEEREGEEEEEGAVPKPELTEIGKDEEEECTGQSEEFSPEPATLTPEEHSIKKEDKQNQEKSDAQCVVDGPEEEECEVLPTSPTSTFLEETEGRGSYSLGPSPNHTYPGEDVDSATPAVVDIPQVTREGDPFIPSTVRRYPPQFFTPQPSRLVGWKNKRSIGLGRGNPVDNPRAFMFPDYPSYYTFPGQPVAFNPPPFVPVTQYYSGTWQFMGPHPQ